MQFFEVDMPKVSQMKIDLVKAVIPDKDKVGCWVCANMPGLPPLSSWTILNSSRL